MAIHEVSTAEYDSFLRERDYAVILYDAPWDVGPGALIRPLFEEAAAALGGRVNFGAVDVDVFGPEAGLPVANVPTVGYFKGGRLVAALIGPQDVAARTRAMLEGKHLGYRDGHD
ncbi:MAG: hypothetical protein BGO49_26090 [Planctomycetales bacterium 71-10]|nr:MAG: hypothetical protein BGO49_26090 [Planctomycetales bacterium 71-10]